MLAKVGAQVASVCVQGKQAGIHRRHQDALATLLFAGMGGLGLGAQAVVAVDVVIAHTSTGHVLGALGVRIELPERLAAVAIKRGDQVFRGA
ncbi:hypothetical protein D3C80_1263840 [compost metagenome]